MRAPLTRIDTTPTLPDSADAVVIGAGISLTRRGDGGHTLAISGLGRVDPTLQQLLYASRFVPMFARRWRSLAPGGMEGFRSGHEGVSH